MLLRCVLLLLFFFFFFNDTATTEIYTLSLHDALPILRVGRHGPAGEPAQDEAERHEDRPLERLTVVELSQPRKDPREDRRDRLSSARGGLRHRGASPHPRASTPACCGPHLTGRRARR